MKEKTVSADSQTEYGWIIEIVNGVKSDSQISPQYISDLTLKLDDHITTTKSIEDALWLAREEDIKTFIAIIHDSIAPSLGLRGIKVYKTTSKEAIVGLYSDGVNGLSIICDESTKKSCV